MDEVDGQQREAKAAKPNKVFGLILVGAALVMGGSILFKNAGPGSAINPAAWFSSGLDGISGRTLAGRVCREGLGKVLTAPASFKIVEQNSRAYDGWASIDIVFDAQNGYGAMIRRQVSCTVSASDDLSLLIRPLDWPASGVDQIDGRIDGALLDLLPYDLRAEIAALPKAPAKAAAPKRYDPQSTKKTLWRSPE